MFLCSDMLCIGLLTPKVRETPYFQLPLASLQSRSLGARAHGSLTAAELIVIRAFVDEQEAASLPVAGQRVQLTFIFSISGSG